MTDQPSSVRRRLFAPTSFLESSRVAEVLRAETVGGMLLLTAASAALVWANSSWSETYADLRDWTIGPQVLHLHLSLGQWAADGLLAIFFFVAGLELKREFVTGELRDPRRAALPVAAAVGGMVVPAVIFLAVNAGQGNARGWAIPIATDIAFAVAVLAVISSHLPGALRTFLLTLAVVDDLLAITVIALFYTDELHPGYLALAILPLLAFAAVTHSLRPTGYLLVPLAVATWVLVHASGVHATVAGVLLGFAVPVRRTVASQQGLLGHGLAEHVEHLTRPISAGVAVPVFAFFTAGVTVGGLGGLTEALTDPVAVGVVAGLVLGKSLGVIGSTYTVARFTRAELDEDVGWVDVVGLSLLTGIGFTVSLLIGELAFGAGTLRNDHAKVGVLAGSLVAALLAAVVLVARNRAYRRIEEQADG